MLGIVEPPLQKGKEQVSFTRGEGVCFTPKGKAEKHTLPACLLHTRVLALHHLLKHSILTLLRKTHPLPSIRHIVEYLLPSSRNAGVANHPGKCS